MYYLGPENKPFLKILVWHPKSVATYRELFEKGFMFKKQFLKCLTYESSLAFTLRFMIDIELMGFGWLQLPKGNYKKRANDNEKATFC